MRCAGSILLFGNAIAVVFEYETDVPQFSETLYLPIFLATGLAVAWVARAAVPVRAPVTSMVLGYALVRLGIAAALAVLGRSGPDLPIAVLGFALVDLPLPRAVQRYAAGAAGASALGWAAAAAGLSSQSPDAVAVVALPTIVVCVEMLRDGRTLEAWVAVPAGRSAHVAEVRVLYLPARAGSADRPVQIAAGAMLYLVGLALLVAAARVVRRAPG